jgi:hypothetical protein
MKIVLINQKTVFLYVKQQSTCCLITIQVLGIFNLTKPWTKFNLKKTNSLIKFLKSSSFHVNGLIQGEFLFRRYSIQNVSCLSEKFLFRSYKPSEARNLTYIFLKFLIFREALKLSFTFSQKIGKSHVDLQLFTIEYFIQFLFWNFNPFPEFYWKLWVSGYLKKPTYDNQNLAVLDVYS